VKLRARFVFVCCVVASFLVAPTHPAQPSGENDPPGLTLEAEAASSDLRVAGASAGSELTLFGVSRRMVGFLPTTIRYEREVTADATGAAEVLLEEAIPDWSVWFVVDRSSGEYAIASPEDAPVTRIDFPARGLGSARKFLEDQRQHLELLVVRPETGAGGQANAPEEVGVWGLAIGDGGQSDRDGATDGRIRLAMLDLRSIGDSPLAPEALRPGDVVMGVDGESLRYYVERLAAPPDDGGQRGGS